MVQFTSNLKRIAIASIVSVGLAPAAFANPEAMTTIAQGEPTTLPGEIVPDADIVDVASSIDDFSTLVAAIQAAGLVDYLKSDGPFTVFAPTNEAFESLDAMLMPEYGIGLEDLLKPENQALLEDVLSYHVVPGAAISSGDIPNGTTVLDAANNNPLEVNRMDEDIDVDGVSITAYDVPASNGVIHVLDEVLLPPDVIVVLEEASEMEMTDDADMAEDEEMTDEPAMTEPATTTTQPETTTEPVRGLW